MFKNQILLFMTWDITQQHVAPKQYAAFSNENYDFLVDSVGFLNTLEFTTETKQKHPPKHKIPYYKVRKLTSTPRLTCDIRAT